MRQAEISIRRTNYFTWKPELLSIPRGRLLVWMGFAISLKDVG